MLIVFGFGDKAQAESLRHAIAGKAKFWRFRSARAGLEQLPMAFVVDGE